MPNRRRAALRLQAAYYIATGAAPLLSRRAFEAVTGPKTDWWLVQMVGLLAVTAGVVLAIGASADEPSRETIALSGLAAASFGAIDVIYALKRRISPIYLADALAEAALAGFTITPP